MAPRELPPLDLRSRVDQYTERTPGLHLSQIITDIMVGLEPDKYGPKDDPHGKKWANFYMGLLFERVLEEAWVGREATYRPELIRPGEIERDGIIGTPDSFDTLLGRPEEFKFTKKSVRQGITHNKFWVYWVQLMAYAYMLGVNSGVLRVCFVNGNYTRDDNDPDSGYVIRSWEDHWSELQLQENWDMLRAHARNRGWL